jgi:hypothetical protein
LIGGGRLLVDVDLEVVHAAVDASGGPDGAVAGKVALGRQAAVAQPDVVMLVRVVPSPPARRDTLTTLSTLVILTEDGACKGQYL